jgi:hypothetical protein
MLTTYGFVLPSLVQSYIEESRVSSSNSHLCLLFSWTVGATTRSLGDSIEQSVPSRCLCRHPGGDTRDSLGRNTTTYRNDARSYDWPYSTIRLLALLVKRCGEKHHDLLSSPPIRGSTKQRDHTNPPAYLVVEGPAQRVRCVCRHPINCLHTTEIMSEFSTVWRRHMADAIEQALYQTASL